MSFSPALLTIFSTMQFTLPEHQSRGSTFQSTGNIFSSFSKLLSQLPYGGRTYCTSSPVISSKISLVLISSSLKVSRLLPVSCIWLYVWFPIRCPSARVKTYIKKYFQMSEGIPSFSEIPHTFYRSQQNSSLYNFSYNCSYILFMIFFNSIHDIFSIKFTKINIFIIVKMKNIFSGILLINP